MNMMFSVRSHKGNMRGNNEDNLFAAGITLPPEFCDRPFSIDASVTAPVILAVCDGIGGEELGELASRIAVIKLSELQRTIGYASPKEINGAVQAYIEAANYEISSYGVRSGTTIALAAVTEKGVHCFNVGDSRIYCLQSGMFTQVTNDHTQGAEIARSGIISMEQARQSKSGNKLTRCIGFGNCFNMDSYPAIKGKCRLLLCSDGLTDMVSDLEIKNILVAAEKPSDAAEQLLELALSHGGKDNVTIITVDIPRVSFWESIIKKFRR